MAMDTERLQNLKLYMKVDTDEEDALISDLYGAAVAYLWNAGVSEPELASPQHALWMLAVSGLVLHWYDNRGNMITGTIVSEIPLGLRASINQLKFTSLA